MKQLPSIPGYRIIKKLGQGGMADVFLGVQENLNREVAIKVLIPSLFRDQQFSTRFIKEAQTAAQLVHPNIITIHDVGQAGDSYYIVMEFLSHSLNQRMKKTGTVPPSEALKIIQMIAGALDYAHNQGFIHRDIKPDNIMFRTDGTVVLVDFGIARAMDSSTQLTRTGMSIGTPHYMSPEQCRGEKIDGRSDIYSLGVQLFELLTGHVPYRAENTAGIIIKHIQEPIPMLPEQSKMMQPLLNRMMAKNKLERMDSGKEVSLFIDAMLTAESQDFLPTISNHRQELEPVDQPTMLTPRPSTAFITAQEKDSKKGLVAALVMIAVVAVSVGLFFLLRDNSSTQGKTNVNPLANIANNSVADNSKGKSEPADRGLSDINTKISQPEDDAAVKNPNVVKNNNQVTDKTPDDGGETLVEDRTPTPQQATKPRPRQPEVTKKPAKKRSSSAIDRQLSRDKQFNNYLKQARNDLAKGDLEKGLQRLKEAKKLKQTPELGNLEKEFQQLKKARLNRAEALKEQGPIKTVTMLGLKPELRKIYNERIKRVHIRIPTRAKWKVTGAVALIFAIDEKGGISIKLENDDITVSPKRRKRLIMATFKRRLMNIKLPEPKDKNGRAIKVNGWRVSYKVGKFGKLLILTKQ